MTQDGMGQLGKASQCKICRSFELNIEAFPFSSRRRFLERNALSRSMSFAHNCMSAFNMGDSTRLSYFSTRQLPLETIYLDAIELILECQNLGWRVWRGDAAPPVDSALGILGRRAKSPRRIALRTAGCPLSPRATCLPRWASWMPCAICCGVCSRGAIYFVRRQEAVDDVGLQPETDSNGGRAVSTG